MMTMTWGYEMHRSGGTCRYSAVSDRMCRVRLYAYDPRYWSINANSQHWREKRIATFTAQPFCSADWVKMLNELDLNLCRAVSPHDRAPPLTCMPYEHFKAERVQVQESSYFPAFNLLHPSWFSPFFFSSSLCPYRQQFEILYSSEPEIRLSTSVMTEEELLSLLARLRFVTDRLLSLSKPDSF